MPYSGYMLRYRPECLPDVLATLKSFPELAIGEPAGAGLPLAATTATSEEAMVLNERIGQLPGVLSVMLVYHSFEDSPEPPDSCASRSTESITASES